jgi:hypothetical protein
VTFEEMRSSSPRETEDETGVLVLTRYSVGG